MTWIKICGITNLEDALTAVDAGADALGFVFYEKSPRKMLPAAASAIIKGLPGTVEKVGVFIDNGSLWENIEEVVKKVKDETDESMRKEGEDVAFDLGLHDLKPEI